MKPISHLVLAVELCLLFAMGVYGQTQLPTGIRSADASPTVSRPVEPDSPRNQFHCCGGALKPSCPV